MQLNRPFTAVLCIQQALVCYLNSCIFKNLALFGESVPILTISNIAEVANNIARALCSVLFKYIGDNEMFVMNNISAVFLVLTTISFVYAIYDSFNLPIGAASWIINRLSNSVTASCRDCILYRLNRYYNIEINIPIVKTIKACGNLLHLLKIVLLASSIYNISLIYVHFFIAIILGICNLASCYILQYIGNKMLIGHANYTVPTNDIDTDNKIIIANAFKLLFITILLNIAQVDNAIVYYKIANSDIAFILKQCVGQIGLGMLYAIAFKNSKAILLAAPLINLLFHHLSLTEHHYIGALVLGLQFTIKNTSYILLSILLCPYHQFYPAVCILSDAISIAISNFMFIFLDLKFSNHFAHTVFRYLGVFSLIFGIFLYLYAVRHSVKTDKNKNNNRSQEIKVDQN